MKKLFGIRSDGREAYSYTITGGGLTAEISDHGATILRLWVPDKAGNLADVILGFNTPDAYDVSDTHTGAVVGRSCNRIRKGQFTLNGKTYQLDINNGSNIIPIDSATHRKVSGYYSRIVPGTDMSFRDWIAYKGFTFEEQQKIGEYVLEMYGVKVK